MAEVLFDKDTAAGKLARYQEVRKYLLQKTAVTATDLNASLPDTKTKVDRQWWRDMTHKLLEEL